MVKNAPVAVSLDLWLSSQDNVGLLFNLKTLDSIALIINDINNKKNREIDIIVFKKYIRFPL